MKNDKAEYLIIGNSTAAISAAEGIRSIDKQTPIMLVSKEPWHTYSRPLISSLLAGKLNEEEMSYRPKEFYEENGIQEKLGLEAVRVDVQDKIVWTAANEFITFGKLLIATGSSPSIPPIEGWKTNGVFTHMCWDDAQITLNYIANNSFKHDELTAIVIGGGLIGIKAAEALCARGLHIVIVEAADRVLSSCLNPSASQLVEETMREAGVEIRCGNTVERILNVNGVVAGVVLKKGEEIPARMIIIASGVAPNTDLVKGTVIGVERGILIDECCRTSAQDIYAAGDVAQYKDTITGNSCVIPIFPNAFRQGKTAGINMAGGKAVLTTNFVMNSAEIFGLPVISLGLAAASAENFEVIEKIKETERSYKRFVLNNNCIVGALFIGDIDRAGIIAGLIREKLDITRIKELLLTNEFGLLSLPAEYRKHVVRGEGIEV